MDKMDEAQKNDCFDIDNSKDYVESVMLSQHSAVVEGVEGTPVSKSGKRRHQSDTDISAAENSAVKKSKCERPTNRKRRSKASRRQIGTKGDCSEDGRDGDDESGDETKSLAFRMTKADVHVDADVSTNQLILKMNNDMHSMFESLTKKMDSIATEIENKLSRKFSQMLDKRINSEISKVKQEIDTRITTVKEDLYDEIKDLTDKVVDIESRKDENENSRELNIVLRNVPERRNENECDVVNGILKDGLRLRDVTVTKARRISAQNSENNDSGRDSKPGVIIASLRNKDDKTKVMENKKKLNESRNRHKGVFIHSDQSREERLQRTNMKTLIDCIKQGDSGSLQLKGSRVVREKNNSEEQSGYRNQIRPRGEGRNTYSGRNRDSPAREQPPRDRSGSGRTLESREYDRGAPRRDFQRDGTRNGRRQEDIRRGNPTSRDRK